MKKIMKEEGIGVFYRLYWIMVVMNIFFIVVYFVVYEVGKKVFFC